MLYRDLKVTETAVKKTETLISPDSSYNSGDRRSIITVTLEDLQNLEFTNALPSSLVDGDSSDFNEVSMSRPIGYVNFELAQVQMIDQLFIYSTKFNNINVDIESSVDNINWITVGNISLSDSSVPTKTSAILSTRQPSKYLRLYFNADGFNGEVQQVEFNTSPWYDVVTVNSDGLATGQFDFQHSFLSDTDSSDNKKVSFNVLNNDAVGADILYEVFSFTGQRDNDIPIMVFNSDLELKHSLTCEGTINAAEVTISGVDVLNTSDVLTTVTDVNKIVTQSDISALGGGDMVKLTYDSNDDGTVDNADNATTVNGLTVETAVPSGALFTDTDTVYTHPATHSISEVSDLQTTLDGKVDKAGSSPIRLPSFNIAGRDGLTAGVGDMIFNSETGKFQGYNGTGWVDLNI